MRPLKILFLDILTDDPKVRELDDGLLVDYEGYAGLFHRCLREENELYAVDAATCGVQHLFSIEERVPRGDWDAIIIGGSVADISDEKLAKPWQTKVLWIISKAIENSVPVLGICGGHQYGAVAIRGFKNTVTRNPLGDNRGTGCLLLNSNGIAHPLFRGCDTRPIFQWNHAFIVRELPTGSVLLGSHPQNVNAAFQYGSLIGLQFHPEYGALKKSDYGIKIMMDLLERKIKEAESEEERHGLETIARYHVRPAPESAKVFDNWVEMIRTGFFK